MPPKRDHNVDNHPLGSGRPSKESGQAPLRDPSGEPLGDPLRDPVRDPLRDPLGDPLEDPLEASLKAVKRQEHVAEGAANRLPFLGRTGASHQAAEISAN